MSAEENAGSASVEANTGDVTSPEVSTDVAAQSKPEVTSSDHVTDDSSTPQSGSLLLLHLYCICVSARPDYDGIMLSSCPSVRPSVLRPSVRYQNTMF